MPRYVPSLLRRATAPILLAAVLLTALPATASACLWNWTHDFAPLPPCTVEDQNALYRAVQLNTRMAGKLALVVTKVAMVKNEIVAWGEAQKTGRAFQQRLREIHGVGTINPLPSLQATFHPSGLLNAVMMDSTGNIIQSTITGVGDARAQVAGAQRLLQQQNGAAERYFTGYYNGAVNSARTFANANLLTGQIKAMGEFNTARQTMVDSLRESGDRLADRYSGNSSAVGYSEAKISQMSGALTRLRASGFVAQSRAVDARLQALQSATQKRREVSRYTARISPKNFGF